MKSYTRSALLGSAITAGALIASTPAQAQCAVTATTVTCATTNTTDTTYPANPQRDRHYPVDTSASVFTGTVSTGAVVDGFGLAFTNTVPGANALNVVNNGTVQINAGNTATQGGSAALDISAIGATNVNYSGAGDVLNLGNSGDGLRIDTTGTGDIIANVGGDVTSAAAGNGIYALNSGTSGDVTITTATGSNVRANFVGVFAEVTGPTSDGAIDITNNATIGSVSGPPGTLTHGVAANNYGTGSITIGNNGDIGSATDVPIGAGVLGQILNIASTGNVNLTNTGDIYVADAAISGYNEGQGAITINNSGALVSTTLPGIYAQQAGTGTTGNVTVTNSGSIDAATNGIQTSNAGTGGVSIANTGAITADLDGIRARVLNVTSPGAASVTGSGAISSGRTGILATTAGTGPVTVNYTGAVNSTGARGIDVAATTGTTSVTTGAGAISASGLGGVAINAGATTGAATVTTGAGAVTGADYGVQVATTGTQAITANGAVTGTAIAGVHSDTTANRTITVGTAGNVSGGTQAILLTNIGTATIGNAGTIGAASTGLALDATTAGAVTLNNNTTGIVNGRLTLGASGDTFANQGNFNTQGVTDFAGGIDTLTNTGTITINGATTFANLENFNQNGQLNLNNFVLTGTGGTFTNGGTTTTTGNAGLAGFTALDNTGTMNLAAGTFIAPTGPFSNSGTLNATGGATTITGQTVFNNSGTLNLQDGAPNDTLTINSNFVGSGASTLNVDASDTLSDRLVINGAASGSTLVNANLTGPTGALVGGGLLVVDTLSSTADAFTLGSVSGTASPLINYSLDQVGADYFLNSSLTATGFAPVPVGMVAQDFWYQSADTVIANNQLPDNGTRSGPWAKLYYGHDKTGDNDSISFGGVDYDVNNKVTTDRSGIQAGYGFGFGGVRAGVTAGWANADADGNAANYRAHGWNIGGYAGFGGAMGIHGSALAKYDRYDIDMSGLFDDTRARSVGLDGDVGYRFGTPEGTSFDVNAGVSHVRTKLRGVTAGTLDYDYDSLTSTRGRLGARASFGGAWGWFVDGKAYHEFDGDSKLTLSDGVTSYDLDSKGRGTWGRVEAGFGGSSSGTAPSLSAYADFGDVKGFGVRAGMRF